MTERYNYAGDFQDLILACVVSHPEKFMCYASILNQAYFSGSQRVIAAGAILDYWAKYGFFPAWEVLGQLIFDAIADRAKDEDTEQALLYVNKLRDMTTQDVDVVVSKVVEFAREQATYNAITKAYNLLSEGKVPSGGLAPMFDEALKIGTNLGDIGYVVHEDVETVIKKVTNQKYGLSTGYTMLDEIWPLGWGPGWLIVPLAPPKRYKCEHPDTEILMYDGTLRRICDVKVNDRIMGDDSTPRTVLSCGYGYGPMYKVTQANGDSYTVNSDHILCLKRPTGTEPIGRFHNRYHAGSFLEITAEEYAQKPAWFRRTWKGYKVGVEFPQISVPLNPYFLGLWLGDGSLHKPSVAVGDNDHEISNYLLETARTENTKVRIYRKKTRCSQFHFVRKPGLQNPITAKLRATGVLDFKHIPPAYKTNSRTVRLQLLAGLIDSDGSHTKNRGFIFVNINEQLCKDTCWIARSLGFKSFVRKVKTCCTVNGKRIYSIAYRTYIQGQISEIPTKIARKRGKNSVKVSNRTTIKVKSVGNGQWFGIEIDSNRKYLHSDFTVTHNTAFCLNLALNMVGPMISAPVFYYPCEITQDLAMIRILCNLAGLGTDDLFKTPNLFKERALAALQNRIAAPLIVKGFPSGRANIGDIRAHAKMVMTHFNVRPKAIIIDYAETVLATEVTKNISDWRLQAAIYTEARALGAEFECVVVMPDRCNKETVGKSIPSMKSFQGAFQKAGIVDGAIGLCADEAEYMQGIIRYFVFLNRHGAANQHLRGSVDPVRMRMTIDERIPYNPEDEDGDDSDEEGRKRRVGRTRRKDKIRDIPNELK